MAQGRRKTPAIPDRTLGEWQPTPQFIRIPLPGVQPAAANPVVPFRYGRDVLAWPEAFVVARHLPFPYWQEMPASPGIGFRYGRDIRDILESDRAFSLPHFLPYPWFSVPIPPAGGRKLISGALIAAPTEIT